MSATTANAYRPFGAFRFLLAAMVVVSHLQVLAGRGSVLSPLGLGNMGVMTFFVLSGYVIAEAIALFYAARPASFLVNRVLRIFPPFLIALLLSVAIHWALAWHRDLRFFDPITAPEQMFEASNMIGNALSLAVPVGLGQLGLALDYLFVRYSWAVGVEMLFYYGMAALVWISLRPAIRARVTPGAFWTGAALLALLAFVASMLSRIGYYQFGWLPYFVLGVALYHRSTAAGSDRYVADAIVWISLFAVNWHAYQYVSRNPASQSVAALLILDALIVLLWLLSRVRVREQTTRIDQFLGDLTYPLYLNHYAVGILFLSLVPEQYFSIGLFCASFVAAILFSYAAMQMSEPFTQRLRERIRGRRL